MAKHKANSFQNNKGGSGKKVDSFKELSTEEALILSILKLNLRGKGKESFGSKKDREGLNKFFNSLEEGKFTKKINGHFVTRVPRRTLAVVTKFFDQNGAVQMNKRMKTAFENFHDGLLFAEQVEVAIDKGMGSLIKAGVKLIEHVVDDKDNVRGINNKDNNNKDNVSKDNNKDKVNNVKKVKKVEDKVNNVKIKKVNVKSIIFSFISKWVGKLVQHNTTRQVSKFKDTLITGLTTKEKVGLGAVSGSALITGGFIGDQLADLLTETTDNIISVEDIIDTGFDSFVNVSTDSVSSFISDTWDNVSSWVSGEDDDRKNLFEEVVSDYKDPDGYQLNELFLESNVNKPFKNSIDTTESLFSGGESSPKLLSNSNLREGEEFPNTPAVIDEPVAQVPVAREVDNIAESLASLQNIFSTHKNKHRFKAIYSNGSAEELKKYLGKFDAKQLKDFKVLGKSNDQNSKLYQAIYDTAQVVNGTNKINDDDNGEAAIMEAINEIVGDERSEYDIQQQTERDVNAYMQQLRSNR